MPFGQELFDPTVRSPGFNSPIAPDLGPPGTLPAAPGITNVKRFEAAFRLMLPGYHSPGYRANHALWNISIQGKILYLPTGRYLVEQVIQLGWEGNLWERYAGGEVFTGEWNGVRRGNPFGASLMFPAEITLWMAPGAVLVPAEGAIVHIASALVCDPVHVFDLSFGGLVVFGERVPKLMPEWWRTPGRDDAEAVQHAIDAGLHHRYNRWETPVNATVPFDPMNKPGQYGVTDYVLPPVPVELRGGYQLGEGVEVRGGTTTTRLLEILGTRGTIADPRRFDVPGDPVVSLSPEHDVVLAVRHYRRDAAGQFILLNGQPELVVDWVEVPVNPSNPSTTARLRGGDNYDRRLITVELLDLGGRSRDAMNTPLVEGTQVRIEPATLDATGATTIHFAWADGTPSSINVRVDSPARGRREVIVVANLTVQGVWQGLDAQGAQLAAHSRFRGAAVLKLVCAGGFTLREVAIDAREVRGRTCLDIPPYPDGAPQSIQGMGVERCAFDGVDATLVQLGAPLAFVPSHELAAGSAPVAYWSNYGADMSGIAFDRCEFRPQGHSTGVAVRTSQSVPFRFQGCEFVGEADAMIQAWGGTFLLHRCRFENTRVPSPPASSVPGFETPDGVDVYLQFEPKRLDQSRTAMPRTGSFHGGDLAAFTAVGCASKSPTFLSTPSLRQGIGQYTSWPVLLLNVRHLPAVYAPSHRSIHWHLRAGSATLVQPRGQLAIARMGPSAPLVVVGGQFAVGLTTSPGAAPCAVVGVRDLSNWLMRVSVVSRPLGVEGYAEVFVMLVDQRLPT